jgi:uncharacterized membrane protein YbjE (DUF340 family)
MVMKIPTETDCIGCDLNKSIWKSQRGMILVVLSIILAYMWTIAVIAAVKYDVAIDMTTINAITVAVGALAGWYSYSKGKENEKLTTIKQQ